MRKKVCIIGAGLSGLTTIKELVEEGHEVICFEKNDGIGGVFNQLNSYHSLRLTVSNYFMAYSDFMPKEDQVRFWTRYEYQDYLHQYAEHFDLLKYIRFGCVVQNITQEPSGFQITIQDTATGTLESVGADNLVICSGQFQKPNVPKIQGLNTFTGNVLHSADYKSQQLWEPLLGGKRVLCLGMGESATDIVAEVAEIAGSTLLSLRRHHIFSKRYINQAPQDVYQTRYWHSLPATRKANAVRRTWRYILKHSLNPADRHTAEHMLVAPDEPGAVVTKSERIFDAVAHGMQVDIGGIEEIKGSTVFFKSGRVEEFDAIVLCTGFEFYVPFLKLQQEVTNIREFYLQMFHPELREKAAFIGFVRPQQGGIPLMAELQARYYALVLSGKRTLPPNVASLTASHKAMWEKEFYETPHVFGLVNGLRYNEMLADLIGCRPQPPFPLSHPWQFLVYWFHHVWPCQFRLTGPGSRPAAQRQWLEAPTALFLPQDSLPRKLAKYAYAVVRLVAYRLLSYLSRDQKMRWRPIFNKHFLAQSQPASPQLSHKLN